MGTFLSTPARQLLTAARQGDHQQVDTLLQQDPALIHACTLFRQSTVLHLAASNNLPELITTSLAPYIAAAQREVQANCHCGPALQQLRRLVDVRDSLYCTPLLSAVKKGSLACARVLAERAANLLSEDRDGNSALHLASFHGHTAAVEYLLEKTRARGILHRLLNRRNLAGYTALHCAAWGGHAAAVALLLDANACCNPSSDGVFDAYMPAPPGSTPLHLAAAQGQVEVALGLLKHYALQSLRQSAAGHAWCDLRGEEDGTGRTPSQVAVDSGHPQLGLLLDPQLPLESLFDPEQLQLVGQSRQVPPPLQDIAGRALQQRLLAALAAAVASKPSDGSSSSSRGGDPRGVDVPHGPPGVEVKEEQDHHICTGSSSLQRGSTCSSSYTSSWSSSSGWGSPGCGGRLLSCCRPSDSFDSLQRLESGRVACISQQPCSQLPGKPCLGVGCSLHPGSAALEVTVEEEEVGSTEGDDSCGVCLDGAPRVGLAPCRHALCAACARQLVNLGSMRPPACPFCRVHIEGFQAVEQLAV